MAGVKKYKQMPHSQKLAIAKWIVAHPDLTVKQIAADLSLNRMMVYRIIYEYIEVKTVYALKATEKPAE